MDVIRISQYPPYVRTSNANSSVVILLPCTFGMLARI